jgi:uncharacterized protein (TIGR00661 family)
MVCPLDWGLGHASRDVVLIRRLLDAGHELILAGDGDPMKFLEAEFPDLEKVELTQSLHITYFRKSPAWLKILFLSPLFLYGMIREHYLLKKAIRHILPDLVISDNRYGLWSRKVRCIIVTHQCRIKLPGFMRFMEYPLALLLKQLIERFDQCWIPDYPGGQNLSGELAHRPPHPDNARFIGPLSRFSLNTPPDSNAKGIEKAGLLVLLSGPEPQRSTLEKIILEQVGRLDVKTLILQGRPGRREKKAIPKGHVMLSHLDTATLKQLMQQSDYIICRSGYTGIMDLVAMRKKALVIPTPGQTEQEYLASYLSEKGVFLASSQRDLDLVKSMARLEKFEPSFPLPGTDYLREHIEDFSWMDDRRH